MSLVNTMLQDLEQRRTPTADTSAIIGLSGSQTVKRGKGVGHRWLWLGFSLSLLAVVFLVGERQLSSVAPAVDERVVSMVAETLSSPEKKTPVVMAPVITVEKAAPVVVVDHTPKPPPASSQLAPTQPEQQAIVPSAPVTVAVSAPEPVAEVEESTAPITMQKKVRPLNANQKARMNLKAAVKALEHNDNQTAIVRLRESLQQDASLLRARETLAALYLNDGRTSEAAEVLRTGLHHAPRTTSLAMLYARLLVNQGQLPQALSVLERARPAMADNLSFYALLAAYYQRDGKHSRAISIYRDAVKYQPAVASWWLGLGVSLDAMNSRQGNDVRDVLNAYQQAYRSNGLSAEVRTYVRSRIDVLAARVSAPPVSDIETDSLFASVED